MKNISQGRTLSIVISGCYPPPFGGVATLNKQYSEFWAKQGHRIYIFDIGEREQFLKKEAAGTVHVYKISLATLDIAKFLVFHIRCTLRFLVNYPRELADLMMCWIKFFSYIGRFFYIPAYIYLLMRELATLEGQRVNIVHSHGEGRATVIGRVLSSVLNVPFVVSVYGGMYTRLTDNKYASFINYLVDNATVIAPSRHCARPLIEFFNVPKEKVNIVYSGIDTHKYNPNLSSIIFREKIDIGKNEKVVLYVGHIRPRKGAHFLIRAIPYITKRVKNVKFLFVGPDIGGFKSTCEKIVKELKVERYVVFVGDVSGEMLPSIYACTDVFIFPSITPLECMGMTMKEAMASGKPVIGFKIDGVPEAIVNGVTGFLVEIGDIKMLADTIIKLLSDVELADSMGKRSRERARTLFDYKLTANQLLNIYIKAISNRERSLRLKEKISSAIRSRARSKTE